MCFRKECVGRANEKKLRKRMFGDKHGMSWPTLECFQI